MNRCLFLDRDGTINVYGKGFNGNAKEVALIPGAGKLIASFSRAGYKIIVITNQGGIGRGYYTESDLNAVNERINGLLKEYGGQIDAVYYCPHDFDFGLGKYKKDCPNRKPGAGLVFKAAKDFGIDLKKSLFIGDNFTDMMCAKNAGVSFYPLEFRDVLTTSRGFRIRIDRYSDALINKILDFAENL